MTFDVNWGEPQALESLQTIYQALYKKARAKHPELPPVPVAMEVTPEARTSDRSYAFFRYPGRDGRVRGTRDGSRCGVKLSPELALNEDRALAVVAHEIGHAVDHWVDPDDLARRLAHVARPDGRGTVAAAGLPSSPERLADLIGETILGASIFYDAELVQTIAPGGKRPRPAHLG